MKKSKKILVTAPEWFDNGNQKNPIRTFDHAMEAHFPEFYCVDYDTKLCAANPPTREEKEFRAYNDYRDRYGTRDLTALDAAIQSSGGRTIYLNGFDQQLFEYIAPQIRDTAEIINFCKCSRISDLSVLAQFPRLQCVHIFHNTALTTLWDMSRHHCLKAISFCQITKLEDISSLLRSTVEYIHMDSEDFSGSRRPALFDPSVFDQMPRIKHLSLAFSKCITEKTW